MAIVEKAAFIKDDGNFIHPETCADVVYYDENKGISVKEKIDEIIESMAGMTYVSIKIESFTSEPEYVEKGGVIGSVKFNFSFKFVCLLCVAFKC